MLRFTRDGETFDGADRPGHERSDDRLLGDAVLLVETIPHPECPEFDAPGPGVHVWFAIAGRGG